MDGQSPTGTDKLIKLQDEQNAKDEARMFGNRKAPDKANLDALAAEFWWDDVPEQQRMAESFTDLPAPEKNRYRNKALTHLGLEPDWDEGP